MSSEAQSTVRTLEALGDGVDEEIGRRGPWFHNLHLPDGRQTAPDHPLGDFPSFKWAELGPALPHDLRGWRALDVGCNAGFYSFELAQRGAEVLGIDIEERYLAQARWAADHMGEAGQRVRFRRMQVYQVAQLEERFDLINFMGVFYHLRYPLLALDILSEACDKVLVLQSLSLPGEARAPHDDGLKLEDRGRLLEEDWPKMAFVPSRLAGDPTNWWLPNHAAMAAMVEGLGFEIEARPGHEIYVCRRATDGRLLPWRDPDELRAATGRLALGDDEVA